MSDKPKRSMQIETSCSIKVNTGNLETLDINKKIIVDIEFSSPAELKEKSTKVDLVLIQLVKDEVDNALQQMGRSRHAENNGQEVQVGTWEDFSKAFSGLN